MKIIFLFNLFLVLSINNIIYCCQNIENFDKVSPNIRIKVLLNDQSLDKTHLTITSNDNLKICNVTNEKNNKTIGNKLDISLDNDLIYLNGKKFAGKSLLIKSNQDHLNFENRNYHGSFIVLKDKAALLLINLLDLEDYVSVVLRTESWPGWPVEANKVLAICIRTYAVNKILESKKNKKKLPYQIKTTTEHQTYKGILQNKYTQTLLDAVKETSGLIITYNNKPIDAMHDSCCAGIIPANVKHIDFVKAPYLARKKVCNYCNISKFYRWDTIVKKDDLKTLLMQEIPNLKTITSISIIEKDTAGIPIKLEIHDNKIKYYLCGKKFYFLNKKIRSYYYTIKKNLNDFVISGRGVGHHLGLCQWGARQLTSQGWDCKSILNFYYPGTSLMKLKSK